MKSIKSKILICMILTVTLSLIAVGATSILLNVNATNALLEQTMAETAKVSGERISQELAAYKNIAIETGCTARLTNPQTSVSDKQAIVNQKAESYGFMRGNIIGKDGISIFTGEDYNDRSYFKQAIQGAAVVSDPLIAKTTGELSIIVAAPLWQGGIPNSTVQGVVFFVPKETFLNDIVSSLHVSENGGAYMLGKTGNTIAHQNIENVKNEENTIKDAQSDAALAPLAALETKMIQNQSGFGEYTYGGVKKFLAFAPIPNTDGWSIGINAPTGDFTGATTQGIVITLILLIITLSVATFLAFTLANGIGRPIKACADRLILLSQGDLSSPVPQIRNQDETGVLANATTTIVQTMDGIVTDMHYGLREIGAGNFTVNSKVSHLYVGDFNPLMTAIYQLIRQLTGTISRISQSSVQVASGSDQVSAGAQALSQGATEQASSVEELAATISEISEQVKSNAGSARQASDLVDEVSVEMTSSNEKMQRMISAMDEISQSSREIGKIIKTIEDIAFQTNILALNAAVEAARAGAAGKGFAVVADEVRNLASKSAEASKNTAGLIEGSIQAVSNGANIASETAASLQKVVLGATQVTEVVNRITTASDEQAASIAQVTTGVDQISSVVQTNSATAQQSAAASEELSGQAQMLKDLVGQFRLPNLSGPGRADSAPQSPLPDADKSDPALSVTSFRTSDKY